MRNVFISAALVALLAIFTFAPTAAVAQKDKAKAPGAGTIEINESEKDGKFRFVIRNADGKGLAQQLPPGGFATEKEALKAVEDLKAILTGTPKIVKHVAKKDK
jgi:hypothetical protein